MDEIDRQIVRIMQEDGGISSAALGERVGASAASCWRRIRNLENDGVLGPVVRLVNRDAVGKGLDVVCQVRIKSHERGAREDFEAWVLVREEIMECLSMSGEWDYQLRVVVADVGAYEAFLMRKLLNHAAVASTASHFALKRIKYTTAVPV
jgi:Lrp/AsnC family transcriptional regulator